MTNIQTKGGAILFSLLMIISAAGGGVVLGSATATGTSTDDSDSRTEQTRITGTTGAVNVSTQVDIDPSDLEGSGTRIDPYQINNTSELQAMEDDLDAHYELVSDIDASNTAQWNNGSGFSPIGGFPDEFSGTFDGSGHTITGIYINTGRAGLFGVSGGVIQDVYVKSINVSGGNNAGSLVGRQYGTGMVKNVSVSGTVKGEDNVGGVFGRMQGAEVRNVSAKVNVTGEFRVGGIVGYSTDDSYLRGSSSRGAVTGIDETGGIVGMNVGTVDNAFAVGPVSSSGDNVGGAVGVNEGFSGTPGKVTSTYWDTKATGQDSSAGSAVGLTTVEMQGQAAKTNMSELEFGTVWETQPNDYPALAWQTDRSEDGSSETDDTTPPKVSDPTAIGVTGNGIVVDDEEVTVAANVTDTGSGVETVVANASAFGTDFVALTDDNGDGKYTGTFSVNESAAATTDTAYEIPINATDKAGNVNESVTAGPLEFDDLDTTVSLTPANHQFVSNDTATFDVVVDNATNGVGAWELTVSQAGDEVVNITSVSLNGDPSQQTISIAPDSNSTDIGAALADTNDTGSVAIATITVTNDRSGSSVLDLDVTSLGTEAGFNYDVTDTENASLSTIETTPPEVSVPTAAGTGGDGIVVDGEQVTVATNVTDTQSGVGSVVANASSFGAGTVQMDDSDNDGRYNATFTVDASEAAQVDNAYQIPINATDNAGNTNRTVAAGPLKLGSLDTAVSIVPTDQQVTTTNTTTFDIVVEDATGGVGAWTLNVTQSGEATANITNATLNGAPEQQSVSIAANNDSVSIEAAGGDTADSGSVTVATITVAGDEIGNSVLDLNVTSVETEAGFTYNLTATGEAELTTTPPAVRSIYTGPPTDIDGDGQFEDINGNGNFTIVDVQAFYASRETAAVQNYPARYNYNDIGDVDIVDVQRLYFELQQQKEEQDSS